MPDGVEWNPGETVQLVVAIAAASDEHLQILANLTQVLADEAEVAELVKTTDPSVVVRRLTRSGDAPSAPAEQAIDLDGYASADVVLGLASGLHARPATAFVDVAKGFASDVRVRCGDKVANGKSLAALLTLGAERDATITLLARGDDQDDAIAALVAAVESGLGDEDEPEEAAGAGALGACRRGSRTGRPSPCPGSVRRRVWPSVRSGTSNGAGWWSSARPRTRRSRSRSCAPLWPRHGPSCASCTTT